MGSAATISAVDVGEKRKQLRERKDFRIVAFPELGKPGAEDYKAKNKQNASLSNQDGVLGVSSVLSIDIFCPLSSVIRLF